MFNYVGRIVVFRAPKPNDKNFYTGGFGKVEGQCNLREHKKPCYVINVRGSPAYRQGEIIHVPGSQIESRTLFPMKKDIV